MHKCPNCGQEFEGKFCPECGTQWLEEKPCPQCGKVLKGSAKFCTECGYSFITKPQTTTQPKEPKEPSKFAVCAKTCLDWSKNHLKIVILSGLGLVLVIVLLCLIPTFIAMQTNGTYYKLGYNGEIDRQTYFILKSGTWTDEDGETGKYEINGENITFYFEFFGMQDETQGTLKDRVLKVNGDTFVSDKHKHSYGDWQTVREATCVLEGVERHTCKSCGLSESREIEKASHEFDGWSCNETAHWQVCNVCGYKTEETAHQNNDNCQTCGYYRLNYKLNADGVSYTVTGVSTISYTNVLIPSTYNNLPVTAIGEEAFINCSSLTGITIPDSVTEIGSSAFSGCSSLESITLPFVGSSKTATTVSSSTLFGFIFGTTSYTGSYAAKQYYEYSKYTTYYIPSALKNVTITGGNIFYRSFYNCSGLTSVTIGDEITEIGSYAFDGCSGLTSVTIGNGVTAIGEGAFEDCSGLTSVIIPDSVTEIGSYAFDGCSGLTSVTIGNGVTTIGKYAFYNCSGLTSVTIPDSVTEISNSAFYNCSGLTSVTIGNGVTSIGEYAFAYCSGLTSVNWNAINCTIAGSSSYPIFRGCTNLQNLIIGEQVVSIPASAFYGCSGLTSINVESNNTVYYSIDNCLIERENKTLILGCKNSIIPDDITTIGKYAFYNCSGLTSVTIPDSVTEISNSAFSNCSGLTSVTIPDSVTEISNSAFSNCSGLTSVNWNAINCTSAGSSSYPIFGGCTNLQNLIIGEQVVSIPASAFYGCSGLTSINVESNNTVYYSIDNCLIERENKTLILGCKSSIIPDDITTIGENAFRGCSGLTGVTIPDSITSIGDYAFSNCSGLTSVNWNAINCTIAGSSSYPIFSGSTNLQNLIIGEQVQSIPDYAFYGCRGLTGINVDSNNTVYYSIDNCLIERENKTLILGCKSSIIPDDIITIGENAFRGCSGLTSVTIPDSVTTIGGSAFYGCSGLTSVTIPDSVTEIGSYAFYNCSRLTSIIIPDGVTTIGEYAFRGCSWLTGVTIPDSVTSIGEYAFYYCSGLTDINYNGTKAQWAAISKGTWWNYNTGKYTVHCTDGDIAK